MNVASHHDFLTYYERVRDRTLNLLRVIPPHVMDWAYKPGKFTIADIIRHIAATERHMWAENVSGRPSRYKGCGKELADGQEAVFAYFNEMHRQSMEIFNALNEETLNRKCPNPGGEITTWKWLRAMTEHEIHHRGELYIYLNLLDIATPPIFGLTAEKLAELSQR